MSGSPARVLLNVGCGPQGSSPLPAYFEGWRQLRVDVDASVEPDIIADLTDLSAIPDGSADAVWASHCLEHLYEHQVTVALAEFRRVLGAEGFACVIVPDLQAVARYLVADKLHETLYESEAGPISPHDIFFGYGAAIARGRTAMAHRCGFTPSALQRCFPQVSFGEVLPLPPPGGPGAGGPRARDGRQGRCRAHRARHGARAVNYLFIHQNFPGQYRHVVAHLAQRPGNTVYFITQPNENVMAGVHKVTYPKDPRGPVNCHAYALELDRAMYMPARPWPMCAASCASGAFAPI